MAQKRKSALEKAPSRRSSSISYRTYFRLERERERESWMFSFLAAAANSHILEATTNVAGSFRRVLGEKQTKWQIACNRSARTLAYHRSSVKPRGHRREETKASPRKLKEVLIFFFLVRCGTYHYLYIYFYGDTVSNSFENKIKQNSV